MRYFKDFQVYMRRICHRFYYLAPLKNASFFQLRILCQIRRNNAEINGIFFYVSHKNISINNIDQNTK